MPQLKTPTKICKDFLVGKQQTDPFPKVSTCRASLILQLVNADMWTYYTHLKQKRYLITFIGDYNN